MLKKQADKLIFNYIPGQIIIIIYCTPVTTGAYTTTATVCSLFPQGQFYFFFFFLFFNRNLWVNVKVLV